MHGAHIRCRCGMSRRMNEPLSLACIPTVTGRAVGVLGAIGPLGTVERNSTPCEIHTRLSGDGPALWITAQNHGYQRNITETVTGSSVGTSFWIGDLWLVGRQGMVGVGRAPEDTVGGYGSGLRRRPSTNGMGGYRGLPRGVSPHSSARPPSATRPRRPISRCIDAESIEV